MHCQLKHFLGAFWTMHHSSTKQKKLTRLLGWGSTFLRLRFTFIIYFQRKENSKNVIFCNNLEKYIIYIYIYNNIYIYLSCKLLPWFFNWEAWSYTTSWSLDDASCTMEDFVANSPWKPPKQKQYPGRWCFSTSLGSARAFRHSFQECQVMRSLWVLNNHWLMGKCWPN